MKTLIVILVWFSINLSASAGRESGLGNYTITLAAGPTQLCPSGGKLFARDVVIQNQPAQANMVIGGSDVLEDQTVGGIVVAGGSAISFTQPLNAGDYYDLCKIYADGTVGEFVSITYVK